MAISQMPQDALSYYSQNGGMNAAMMDDRRIFTDSNGLIWMPQWEGGQGVGDSSNGSPATLSGYRTTGIPGQRPGQIRGTDMYFNPQGQYTHTNTDDPGWLNQYTGPLAVLGFGLGANALFGGMGGAGAGAGAMETVSPGFGAAYEASVGAGGAGAAGAAGAAGGIGGTGGAAAGGSMAGISDFITPQIVGGVLGAINGARGTESTQRAEPWAGVQPALLDLYNRASAFMGNPAGYPQYYPGSTVAPQSGLTQQGIGGMAGRANMGMGGQFGAGVLDSAQQQAMRTTNGDFLRNPSTSQLERIGAGEMLNANPYVDAMFNRAASSVGKQFKNSVMPSIASLYSSAGRYGSNSMNQAMDTAQENFGSTLENLGTSIYGGNYANERSLQQQALGLMGDQFGRERANMIQASNFAPTLSGADYNDIQQLIGAGGLQDAFQQRLVDDQVARFNFGQQTPMNMLGFYANLLNGAGNLGRTTTTQQQGDPFSGALGGAMIANSIFGGSRQQPVQQPIIRDSSWDSLFNSD